MADNIDKFTAQIFINSQQARNEIKDLEDKAKGLRKEMDAASKAGDWERFNKLKKDLDSTTRSLNGMKTYAQTIAHVLKNLDTSSVKEIRNTIRAIKTELNSGSVERDSDKWNFLTESLKRCKAELHGINMESKALDKPSFLDRIGKLNQIGFAVTNFFGVEQGITGVIDKVRSLAQDSMEVAKNAQGIELAFQRLNKPGLLDNLRKATHGTIDDIQLMQQAVKFANFNLPVEQLGKLLAFAQQTAKDTGQSIDYMVSSIVDGMSRQSVKILDNLGLSATEIKKKVAETGDFTTGVISVVEERMAGIGDYTDTAADRAARASAKVVNAQKELGDQLLPIRSEFTSVFGTVKLTMLQALTWILKNRDAVKTLTKVVLVWASAIAVATAADKALIIQEKIHAAITAISTARTKAFAAVTLYLRTAVLALRLGLILVTKGVEAYKVALEEAKAASMTNPWTALATVLLTVGTAVYAFIKHLQNEKKAAKEAADATNIFLINQKNMTEISKEANSKVSEEVTRLNVLYKKLKDSKVAYGERKKALSEIQKMVPSYHGAITREGQLINDNVIVLKEYCNNLIKAARAQAAFNKMTKIQSAAMDQETLLSGRQNNQKWVLQQMSKYGYDPTQGDEFRYLVGQGVYVRDRYGNKKGNQLTDGQVAELNHLQKIYDYNVKRTKQINDQLALYKKQTDELQKQVDVSATSAQTGGGSASGGGAHTSSSTGSGRTSSGSSGGSGGGDTLEERLNKRDDLIQKSTERENLLLELQYRQGNIKYSDYLAKQEDNTKKSLAARIKLYMDANATSLDGYYKALQDQSDFDEEQNNKKAKEEEVEIERKRLNNEYAARISIKDQNELNDRLFRIDQDALKERLKLYKEGSNEYNDIANKIATNESNHQKQLKDNYVKSLEEARSKYEQYRTDMGKKTLAEQEILEKETAKSMLDILLKNKEITQEEYDDVFTWITNKYKDLRAEQNSDATLRQQGTEALNKAKTRANVDDDKNNTSGTDNTAIAVFSAFDAVKQQNAVNEQLEELYQNDQITYAQYQEAKKQLSQETTDTIVAAAQAAFSGINNMLSSVSSYAQACSDLETAKITANYQTQIDAAGKNSKKRERLEKQRDKEIAKAKTKSNQKAMKIEIAQALASTALAAINAYASGAKINVWLGPVAAALATAAGMMQVATIKKQHQAEEAGYYEGGYTDGHDYHKEAGVVHQGEFVVNHKGVNNKDLRPVLSLIDDAQKNNRIGNLTADDVSRQLGNNNNAAIAYAPQVNVTTDNSAIEGTLQKTNETLNKLGAAIDDGIDVSMEKFKKAERHWNTLQNNK